MLERLPVETAAFATAGHQRSLFRQYPEGRDLFRRAARSGGRDNPEGLIAIGEVARRYKLYSKITGGQRIDLFGARLEQLPEIWQQLVDAGLKPVMPTANLCVR
ncbi:hypothetical protein M8494_10760 [Serratia ureilytica]